MTQLELQERTEFRAGETQVLVDKTGEAEWNEMLSLFDDANVYQSWAYGAVRWGEPQVSHLVIKKNGDALAMAQVRVVRLPVINRGIAYVRFGPVCRLRGQPFDPAVLSLVTRALKVEYADRRGLLLRIMPVAYEDDPFAEAYKETWRTIGLVPAARLKPYRTIRLDLSQSLEKLRAGFHQSF